MRLRLKRGFGQTLACAETERKARPFTTACRLCEAATDKQLFLVPFGTPAEASGVWRRCINSLEGPASANSVPSRVELTWLLCLHMACTDSNHLHNVPLLFLCVRLSLRVSRNQHLIDHILSLPSLVFSSLHPIKYWIKHGDVSLCLFTQVFSLFFFCLRHNFCWCFWMYKRTPAGLLIKSLGLLAAEWTCLIFQSRRGCLCVRRQLFYFSGLNFRHLVLVLF